MPESRDLDADARDTAPATTADDGSETGRVAVVTGAARGIGAATVVRLAESGWRLIAVDIGTVQGPIPAPDIGYPLASSEQLHEVIAPYGEAAIAVEADVRDATALRSAVHLALTRFGRLDAAVAAAGVISGGEPAWSEADEAWELLFAINVGGVRNLARAAIPVLLEQPEPRQGRFVAVASAAAHQGLERLSAYVASKHAVLGLVRSLAADLKGTGVTAAAVSPGSTRTAMLSATAEIYGLADVEDFAAHQLLGRLLEPDEVAAAVAYLCGRDGAAMTGSALSVDGGFAG